MKYRNPLKANSPIADHYNLSTYVVFDLCFPGDTKGDLTGNHVPGSFKPNMPGSRTASSLNSQIMQGRLHTLFMEIYIIYTSCNKSH